MLVLTSNRPDYIDPAVLRPERIDRKVKVNRARPRVGDADPGDLPDAGAAA